MPETQDSWYVMDKQLKLEREAGKSKPGEALQPLLTVWAVDPRAKMNKYINKSLNFFFKDLFI